MPCFKEITSLQQRWEFVRSRLIQLPPKGNANSFLLSHFLLTFWMNCDDGSHCLRQELCLTDKERMLTLDRLWHSVYQTRAVGEADLNISQSCFQSVCANRHKQNPRHTLVLFLENKKKRLHGILQFGAIRQSAGVMKTMKFSLWILIVDPAMAHFIISSEGTKTLTRGPLYLQVPSAGQRGPCSPICRQLWCTIYPDTCRS